MSELMYQELEGEWTAPPAPNAIPIDDEKYIANLRSNLKRDLPNIKTVPEHDRIMVMVCGGPTAKLHLEEIREKSKDIRYDIFCSNKTHDWLISEGIVPDTHFVIDPKPEKINDVSNPHRAVRYLIGTSCDPKVFDALEGYNVHRIFMIGGVGTHTENGMTDLAIMKAHFDLSEFTPIEGGSMAGLRAMTLANVLGYTTVEFYGFDSCYFETNDRDEPIFYSYEKKRAENLMEAQTDSGRIYLTTPVFSSQARQYVKWKNRLPWIKFIIHGDSLTAEIDRLEEEKNKPAGFRISPYMKALCKDLHKNPKFGAGMADEGIGVHVGRTALLAGNIVKVQGKVDILDYGCGKGKYKELMPPIVNMEIVEYDPCIEGKDEEPNRADLVVCLDVLEHVEPQCLEDVLQHLLSLTDKILYVSVAVKAARKWLRDGQNAHLIVEPHEWWNTRLRKYFYVMDEFYTADNYTAIMAKRKART